MCVCVDVSLPCTANVSDDSYFGQFYLSCQTYGRVSTRKRRWACQQILDVGVHLILPHPELTNQPHDQGQQSQMSAQEVKGGDYTHYSECVRGEAGEGVQKCQFADWSMDGGLQVEEEVEN